jgi:hypothetical protein
MRGAPNLFPAFTGPTLAFVLLFAPRTAASQQATVSTPYHAVGDSFFENIGVGWGIRGKGFNVQFGSPTMAAPQFGGFNPGAGANVGFGFGNSGKGGSFNANFSQGSQRSFVSQVPSVTVTNGVPGYMAIGTVRPFVVSYVPVVGGFPAIPAVFLPEVPTPMPVAPPSSSGVGADAVRDALRQVAAKADGEPPSIAAPRAPVAPAAPEVVQPPVPAAPRSIGPADSPARRLALAQESTAGRPAPSVADAKRVRAAEEASRHDESQVFYERGLSAQQAGNLGAARAYYRMAVRRASGDLQREILQRLEAVKTSSNATTD